MAGDVSKLGKDKNNPFDKEMFSVPVYVRTVDANADEFLNPISADSNSLEVVQHKILHSLNRPIYEVEIAWNYSEEDET